MPLEVANTLEDLDLTWPLNGDPRGQGPAHLRQVKQVSKNIFPGVGGNGFNTPILATEDELDYVISLTSNLQAQIDALTQGGVSIGGIIIYSGAFSGIPANYQLCNGTNGTPNMTNRFIYGTNQQAQILTTGGNADAQTVEHSHTYTHGHTGTLNTTGSHAHTIPLSNNDFGQANVLMGGWGTTTGTGSVAAAGDHTHTPTIDQVAGDSTSAGVVGTDANIPPFIKMAFIQRMS